MPSQHPRNQISVFSLWLLVLTLHYYISHPSCVLPTPSELHQLLTIYQLTMEAISLQSLRTDSHHSTPSFQPSITSFSEHTFDKPFGWLPQHPVSISKHLNTTRTSALNRPYGLNGGESEGELLLILLRILKQYNIAMFPYRRDWKRQAKKRGSGASSVVEEAELPVLEALRLDP